MTIISSVFDLPEFICSLNAKNKAIFDSIFTIEEEKVEISFDSKEAKEYLQKLFKREELEHRHTISITNHTLHQQTLFSPIRSNRPVSTNGNKKLIEISKENCDFCHAKEKTPADIFGRIETNYSITAANAGPYTGLHSLIIPKNIHNPLEVTEEVFLDMMGVAQNWFEKANKYNPKAIFPSLIWNVNGRAGASIYHPHIQVLLTEKPFQKQEDLYKSSIEYQKKYNKPFFDQFTEILKILKLAKISENITTVANLTPVKDKEILIISKFSHDPLPSSFSIKTYSVIDKYIHSLGITNFNLAVMFPSLDKFMPDFPVIAHLVDRGMDGKPSDIAAMELFFASVVSTDPYSLVSVLR